MEGEATKRTFQVEEQMGEMGRVVAALEEIIDNGESRFGDVLRCAPPSEQVDKTPDEEIVPLAARIRSLNRDLWRLNARLKDIISRVEL